MRTIRTTVYTFDELSDEAKDKARDWYRQGFNYDWWDYIYEDAERIGLTITGFDLGGRKDITGHLNVSVEECCERILAEHGPSCETYKLAQEWHATSEALQKAIEEKYGDEEEEERERLETEQEEGREEFERALLEEYFSMLDKEWEWLNSNEQVDESIRDNECEFTENGHIANP